VFVIPAKAGIPSPAEKTQIVSYPWGSPLSRG